MPMEVKRRNGEWLVRWAMAVAVASRAVDGVALGERCVRCDGGGAWISVPDLRPMPTPRIVVACRRCGTVTAHAALLAPRHSVGD